jgi:hypothetical protein
MRNFDFEALETMRDLAVEGFPSVEEERSDLLRDYADELSKAAIRSPLTIAVASELVGIASNMIDFSGDVTEVGSDLGSLVQYGLESSSDVHQLAAELLTMIYRLLELASHSNDAAETLIMLVREAILE